MSETTDTEDLRRVLGKLEEISTIQGLMLERLQVIDGRLTLMERRLGQLDIRMGKVEKDVTAIKGNMMGVMADVSNLKDRVTALELGQ